MSSKMSTISGKKKIFNRDSKVLLYKMQNVFLLILSKFITFKDQSTVL